MKNLTRTQLISSTIILILSGLLMLQSCKKDEKVFTADPQADFGEMVTTSFFGKVVDESGNKVNGAEVQIAGKTTTTNEDGVFIIDNVTVQSELAYIKASLTGYFDASRTLQISSDKKNYVNLILSEKELNGTFKAGEKATITAPDGFSVTFPSANEIVDRSGNPYSGDVNVYIKHLPATNDSWNETLVSQMPGNLYAVDNEGNRRGLGTFGMSTVELENSSGEKLNLAEGTTARLEFPADIYAGSSMPLWYFDEEKGYWVEDGRAYYADNSYTGEVTHFTPWNVDTPLTMQNFKGSLRAVNGSAIKNSRIKVGFTITQDGVTYGPILSSYITTDDEGDFNGEVPSGFDVTLNFSGHTQCIDEITKEVGPYTSDVNVGEIKLDQGLIELNGKVSNCSSDEIKAYLLINDNVYFAEDNGEFDISGIFCEEKIEVKAVDVLNGRESEVQEFNRDETINVGNLAVCDSFAGNQIYYTLDQEEYVMRDGDSIAYYLNEGNSMAIEGFNFPFQGERIFIKVNHYGTGEHSIDCTDQNDRFRLHQYSATSNVEDCDLTIEVDEVGTQAGDFFRGSFYGTFIDDNENQHSLSGNFQFRVD